jgi:hypothetical protein
MCSKNRSSDDSCFLDTVQSFFQSAVDRAKLDDDEEMLRGVFKKLDTDSNEIISDEELLDAINENHAEMKSLLESLKRKGQVGSGTIDFEQFRDIANATPRIKGQRVEWARSLGLEAAFAKYLKVGDLFDPLAGIRNMTEEELKVACTDFSTKDLFRLVKEGRDKMLSKESAQIFQNSKFCLSGSFEGSFAKLEDFYEGPEKLIGSPNPLVGVGTHREHCDRPNSHVEYTSTNYTFVFTPAEEWEFVVSPSENKYYPHTPEDSKLWKQPEGEAWKGDHGRQALPLETFVKQGKDRFNLREEEVVVLRLYTGPMFNLYNAVLRKFPEQLYVSLKGNQYETTLFCIISGIMKISRKTEVPADRRLWRGLGGMILPENFWHKSKDKDQFRGAVENGLMSTTSNQQVAIQYSGVDKKRGTVFEIDAGRIDIGADLSWLSQYPDESEYLFPPLSCLEVHGEPRLEGDVIVFPLRVNLCLKGLTLEQLEQRRKDLHMAMTKNLREELELDSTPASLLSNYLTSKENIPEDSHDIAKANLKIKSMPLNERMAMEGKLTSAIDNVIKEYTDLIEKQGKIGLETFNNDDEYKDIIRKAIIAKSNAFSKIQFYLDNLVDGNEELLNLILQCPFEELAIPGKKQEIKTGLSIPFPWRDLLEKQGIVDFGAWNPHHESMTAEKTELALHELRNHNRFHTLRINEHLLAFQGGWAAEKINWDGQKAVEESPGTVAFLLKNCKALTSISIR